MDFFGEGILNVLRDGKPRGFQQLLNEVDFFHNNLRLHLCRLVDQGLILKKKTPSNVAKIAPAPITKKMLYSTNFAYPATGMKSL